MPRNPETPKSLLERGLLHQVILNEKRFMDLFQDIKRDVATLTKNATSMSQWNQNLKNYVTLNPLTTGAKKDQTVNLIGEILKGSDYSPLPSGAHKELVKNVITENTMHYVQKVGEDIKSQLRSIARDGYNRGLQPTEIAKNMEANIDGLTYKRAKVIARTETMRARNLADYADAKRRGALSYTVDSLPDCCEICEAEYGFGMIVFDIDDNAMIPPIHPNCRCLPVFQYI